MAYVLCDGDQQSGGNHHHYYQSSDVPKERLTWDAFKKELVTLSRVRRVVPTPGTEDVCCAVCTELLTERCSIKRMCRCENFPCEGHMCNCTEFAVCFGCVGKALWQGTNSVMKQKGRFRTKCPFCKAEYCARDIVRLQMS